MTNIFMCMSESKGIESGKIRSTWILPESQDLFFPTRILYGRNGKRILAGNQEKQESGKNDAKIVDL
jgi:hypothetical protein